MSVSPPWRNSWLPQDNITEPLHPLDPLPLLVVVEVVVSLLEFVSLEFVLSCEEYDEEQGRASLIKRHEDDRRSNAKVSKPKPSNRIRTKQQQLSLV
jgi:hypothetical protein